MESLLPLGQNGVSAHLIQCKNLLRPIWPVWSWSIMEACEQDNEATNFSHSFDGIVLSRALIWWYCGEVFHWQAQHFWILDFNSCHRVDTLTGKGFLRDFGSSLDGLNSPLAASLVCWSALSFRAKSMYPGTHWMLRLITPLLHTTSVCLFLCASLNLLVFCILSCFSWRFSTVVWMWSSKYWAGLESWLANVCIEAWLLRPMMIVLHIWQ